MKLKSRRSLSWLAAVGALLVTGCADGVERGEETDSGCGGGCGGEPPPQVPTAQCIESSMAVSSPFALAVGTHDGKGFTVIEDNQKLPMDFGSQGGQHVWVTLRVFGDAEETLWQRSRFDDQTGITSAFKTCTAPQWAEMIDIPVFLDSSELGPKTLHVDVGPDAGGEPTATVSVQVEITGD